MTLVRCPTHGIPFNDQNPRGCPACAQERQGRSSQVVMMRELAEASVPIDEEALAEALEEPSFLERILESLGSMRGTAINLTKFGPPIIAVLLLAVFLGSRPTFVEQPHPVVFSGSPQPLTIMPGQPVSIVHAVLGVQQPTVHPRGGAAHRYSYGRDLIIDEVNGFVYSLEIGVPNRTWRGLQVGIPEQQARGALALLATLDQSVDAPADFEVRSGYQVYPSADRRPTRTYKVETRPPNGCYDATVELRPKQFGLLIDGDRRYSVVGETGDLPQYVVTRIRVTDRSRRGPDGVKAC